MLQFLIRSEDAEQTLFRPFDIDRKAQTGIFTVIDNVERLHFLRALCDPHQRIFHIAGQVFAGIDGKVGSVVPIPVICDPGTGKVLLRSPFSKHGGRILFFVHTDRNLSAGRDAAYRLACMILQGDGTAEKAAALTPACVQPALQDIQKSIFQNLQIENCGCLILAGIISNISAIYAISVISAICVSISIYVIRQRHREGIAGRIVRGSI